MAIAWLLGMGGGILLGLAFAGICFGIIAKLLSMGATYRDGS
jgi:hypothetical protein